MNLTFVFTVVLTIHFPPENSKEKLVRKFTIMWEWHGIKNVENRIGTEPVFCDSIETIEKSLRG